MELFAMGEYGPFVWSSYLLTLLVVIISSMQARRRRQQVRDEIVRQLKLTEGGE